MPEQRTDSLGGYPLKRDYLASIRLNMVHWIARSQLGYVVHPAIVGGLPSEPKIVDLGCGTGQWIIDAVEVLPKGAQLNGFDLSNKQFPHKAWLPSNVKLGVLDCLKDPPPELQGTFDVVHVGLFVTIVREDPYTFLKTVIKWLKPGGFVQWDEADLSALSTVTPCPEVTGPNMQSFNFQVIETYKFYKETFGWIQRLDEVLKSENLDVLGHVNYPIPDSIAKPFTLQHMLSFLEFKNISYGKAIFPTGENKENGDNESLFWHRFNQTCEEAENGVTSRLIMTSTVGRKPSLWKASL